MAYGQGGARGCEAKRPTSSALRLDVRKLVKTVGGGHRPFREGGMHVPAGVWAWGDPDEGGSCVRYELVLTPTGGALALTYVAKGARCVDRIRRCVDRIRLSTTARHLGGVRGVRWWAHCPRCDGRRGVLWGAPFACRECHRLAYTSSQLSKVNRFERKVDQLADKLGALGDYHRQPWQRPKGMRERTYAKLRGELYEAKLRIIEHTRRSAKPLAAYLFLSTPPSTKVLARRRRNQRRRDRRAAARIADAATSTPQPGAQERRRAGPVC